MPAVEGRTDPEGTAMNRLHRLTLGLLLAPLALTACANASTVVSGVVPGDGGPSGGGSSGVSVPGAPGSGGAIDHENPIDRVIKPCGTEEVVGDGPDASVGYTPCPSDQVPAEPVASPVIPTPGMADVRARGWDSADVSADGMRVTIGFVSGIEPCAVLDHVAVDYGAKAVTVTLFEGHDPDAGDVACIDIGVFKSVTVALTEPLDGRIIRDGAD
jgi:hypothetical protein